MAVNQNKRKDYLSGRRSSLRVQMGSSPRADRFDSCRRMAQNPELKGERR